MRPARPEKKSSIVPVCMDLGSSNLTNENIIIIIIVTVVIIIIIIRYIIIFIISTASSQAARTCRPCRRA